MAAIPMLERRALVQQILCRASERHYGVPEANN
jgi:hypothetical protein